MAAPEADLLARLTAAANDVHRSTVDRDRLILALHKRGTSIRRIAAAANLSHTRVWQIVKA